MKITEEKLNALMKREGFDVGVLESTTRKGLYEDIISGKATEKDIENIIKILNTTEDELLSEEVKSFKRIQNLNEEIKRAGFSQKVFCEWVGMAASSIYYYTRGTWIPSDEALHKICWGLNCSVDYILDKTDERGCFKTKTDSSTRKVIVVNKNFGKIFNSKRLLSPHKLANMLSIPYTLLKKVISQGGELPESSVNVFMKKYDISIEDITDVEQIEMELDDIVSTEDITEKKSDIDNLIRKDKLDRELAKQEVLSAIETANRTSELKRDYELKVANLSKPSNNGMISLGQLSSIICIMEKKPELIDTFVELCQLNDEDFKHVHDNLKWIIGKINSKCDVMME